MLPISHTVIPSTPTLRPAPRNVFPTPRRKPVRTIYTQPSLSRSEDNVQATLVADPMPFDVRDSGASRRRFTDQELESIVEYFDCPAVDSDSWVIIEGTKKYKPDEQRPFTVGGKLAFFWDTKGPLPYGLDLLGQVSFGNDDYTLPNREADAEMRSGEIPSSRTFDLILERVPDVSFISYYDGSLLLEFPEVSPAEHEKRLKSIPVRISGVLVTSINGTWKVVTQGYRGVRPDPSQIDGSYDSTDYCPDNLQPGILLAGYVESITSNAPDATNEETHLGEDDSSDKILPSCLTTSGVLLRNKRTGHLRLTVVRHGFGQSSNAVYHPDENGTVIGKVDMQIDNTDIGLADIGDVKYDNSKYFEVPHRIMGLAPASDLRRQQVYMFDSWVTGLQHVVCLGVRMAPRQLGFERKKFMAYSQGIYSATAPIIPTTPKIRMGACGSPLVCDDPAMRGFIGGFHVWVDVAGYNENGSLICLSEVCDSLINEGWEVEICD